MSKEKVEKRNPWFWVPSLYYAEGIPYVVVMTVAVIMYKRMGISNTDIALYTSWLYLPWVIKPLWSPVVDLLKTKRFWIVAMQLLVGAGLAGVAFTIPVPNFFQYTLAFFWLLAFSSATHDIAADGFYMLGLSQNKQAFFVGIRSTFYRLAMITGQGILIILAGFFEVSTGLPPVDVVVKTSLNNSEYSVFVHPDSLNAQRDNELQILTHSSEIEIQVEKIEKAKADSLITFVKDWNLSHNFYQDERLETQAGDSQSQNDKSWFTENISEPIEGFIKSVFGKEEKIAAVNKESGNLGIAYFYISKIPEENIVVNFGSEGGDKSINLVEGTRFVFTKNNWEKPALAIFQLDPKLDEVTTASFQARSGNIPLAWTITFFILAGLFLLFFIYHKFILPFMLDARELVRINGSSVFAEFFKTFALFFKKKNIGVAIAFLLVYRLGESQLVKLASPFMLDARELGGLGLTTGEVGIIYGTIGIIALTLGGILGGFLASKNGLKYWLWWMLIAINLPNLVYVYLSFAQPESFFLISLSVAVEQFGYGFGFTAYMLFMIFISEGDHKTAHFAITTGFMALGMMIPGMISGWLQELIGYEHFFVWVVIATIPAFIITKFVPIDEEFGKKES